MRDDSSRVLLQIIRNSQLLPDPHPALRAAFPGGEGVRCIHVKRYVLQRTANPVRGSAALCAAFFGIAYAALVAYNKNPYSLDADITVKELYERWTKEYFKTLKNDSSRGGIKAAWAYCTVVYPIKASKLRAYHTFEIKSS